MPAWSWSAHPGFAIVGLALATALATPGSAATFSASEDEWAVAFASGEGQAP